MLLTSLKHLVVGIMMVVIGTYIIKQDAAFIAASQPAQLIVLQTDSQQRTDRRYEFRITLGLVTDQRPRPEYRGGFWAGFAMHRTGDVVSGRYDPHSGQMRSDRMLMIFGLIARLAQLLGVVAILQGVLILFGVPESRMPLPVRIGRNARSPFRP